MLFQAGGAVTPLSQSIPFPHHPLSPTFLFQSLPIILHRIFVWKMQSLLFRSVLEPLEGTQYKTESQQPQATMLSNVDTHHWAIRIFRNINIHTRIWANLWINPADSVGGGLMITS